MSTDLNLLFLRQQTCSICMAVVTSMIQVQLLRGLWTIYLSPEWLFTFSLVDEQKAKLLFCEYPSFGLNKEVLISGW